MTNAADSPAAELAHPPLRVGLLLDSDINLFWVRPILEAISRDPGLALCIAIYNAGTTGFIEPARSPWQRLRHNRFLHNRVIRLERWKDQAALARYQRTDISDLLKTVPSLSILPEQTRYTDRLAKDDLARIRQHAPDLLLRFGFRILRGAILDLPPYGVWSYHHGDSDRYRGGPPGFWELINNEPATGCTLQVLTEELDGGPVLGKLHRRSHPVSAELNYFAISESGIALFEYGIQRLKRFQGDPAGFHASLERPDATHAHIYRSPDNLTMTRYVARRLRHHARSRIRRRNKVQWSIALRPGSSLDVVTEHQQPSHWLRPDPSRFWADPFLYPQGGNLYLFLEEYLYAQNKALISVARVNGEHTGLLEPPQPVLECPHHLSFPFVFQHEGEHFMLPEQRQGQALVLYRSSGFPFSWRPYRTLLANTEVVDPVLFQHGGYWWLFCSYARHGNGDNNLHLYYATDLDGEFRPHPMNPVRSSLVGSRMAGAMHVEAGRLLRPAQNCLHRYGGSMIIWQVDTLTPDSWGEQQVHELLPESSSPFPEGLHSLSLAGGAIATDGYRMAR
ncbi:MAG: hypothetical protein JJT85_09640 [Chromatiales bacterium]|nr:hypothetical protein [Chromatiales bacterium]